MRKKRSTLLRRRTTAIVVSLVAIVVLAIALAVVLDYVRTITIVDPADNATYYIRFKDKKYALYDADKKTVMPTESTYGYYVMRSGNLVSIDQEAGTYELIIIDATEGNETYEGYMFSIMMFPHITSENIRQLDVYNSKGSFTFYRYNKETGKVDNTADFSIKGSPLVTFDQQMFAELYVNAGYTIVDMKIEDPIKDQNGEFSEYGLVPETRPLYDEETGEPVIDEATGQQMTYEYVPAYYVLTDTSGNQYKVIIGDMLVTGSGYYVQYVDMSTGSEVKRDAVYVLPFDIGNTMLAAIEDFVTPQISYPMSLNDYFDVEDFYIYKWDESKGPTSDDRYEPIIGFTYVDLSERENTIRASRPYIFTSEVKQGYFPSDTNISACLQALYSPSFNGVKKLAPSAQDLYDYGLAVENGTDSDGNKKYALFSEYLVTYNFDIRDENGNLLETINNVIYFSEINENGKRYSYTEIYATDKDGERGELSYTLDMIVEVNAHTVEFLNWDSFDWITEQYFNLNIAFCDKISISTSNYSAQFDLDNSASGMTDSIVSDKIYIVATDSTGRNKTTFSTMKFVDINGYIWEVSTTGIKMKDAAGQEYKINDARYDHNTLGEQALVLDGFISCADGAKVYVSADEVRIVPLDASQTVTYVRYDTSVFRQFYQTLLYANIVNSYELSAEEKTALENDPGRKMLTMTVVDTEGTTTEYSFYRLTSRKAYITINGAGGFYVMSNRVEKIVSDAQKFFENQMIDPTAKN
ncbi:MAG: hypothetical protein E7653_02310 [Ruminococcaceae bacterium]|nr:hypothetical protein [Oscillospiraceae bacterium]